MLNVRVCLSAWLPFIFCEMMILMHNNGYKSRIYDNFYSASKIILRQSIFSTMIKEIVFWKLGNWVRESLVIHGNPKSTDCLSNSSCYDWSVNRICWRRKRHAILATTSHLSCFQPLNLACAFSMSHSSSPYHYWTSLLLVITADFQNRSPCLQFAQYYIDNGWRVRCWNYAFTSDKDAEW